MSKLKLLVIHSKSGCCFWRAWQPAEWMRKQGLAEVKYIQATEFTGKECAEALRWCDIVHHRGLKGTDGLMMLREYQRLGVKVTADFDDLYFNVSPFNTAYKHFGTEEVQVKDPTTGEVTYLWQDGKNGFDLKRNQVSFHAYKAILQELDLVTTTTVYLKQALSEISGREDNIRVVPNAVDFTQWKPLDVRDKFKDVFRFGWAVSASHGEDWLYIKPAIKEFLSTHPDAKFVCVGDTHMDIKSLGQNQVEWYPFSDLWEYHYPMRMAMLGLDVAIAPLADTEFNKCKSPLKYEEYTAFGWPTIAQNMTPYKEHIIHGDTGLLAGSIDEWIYYLDLLYKDKDLRHKLHFNALQACKELFDLQTVSQEWTDIYKETISGVINA